MLNINKWNIFFVIAVFFTAIYYVVPNLFGKSEVTALPNYLSKKQVNLGLDLQGGSHLLLEVDTQTVLKEKSEDLVWLETIEKQLSRLSVAISSSRLEVIMQTSSIQGKKISLKDAFIAIYCIFRFSFFK